MKKLLTWTGAVALMTTATLAGAQMMDGANHGMGGASPLVTPDGTVLTVRPMTNQQATTPTGMELVAFTPAGTVAWRKALGFGMPDLALAGNLIILGQTAGMGPGGYTGNGAAASSTIVALQLANGVEAWRTRLTGVAMAITVAGDRIYAKVVVPSATGNGPTGGNGGGMHGGGGGMNGGNGGGMNGGSGGMNGGAGMNGAFSLVALGLDGQVVWNKPLAQ
jgi:hypothetical protein